MTNHPQSLKVDGPFTHSNLSLYLLTPTGTETRTGLPYFMPLDQAIVEKVVIVHETGEIGRLEVENLSPDWDVFIQDGDIVRGGRQDRVVRTDFILPAKSGRLPLPTFCVEKRRWGRRGNEPENMFCGAGNVFSARSVRSQMRSGKANQGMVWEEVSKLQCKLSSSVGEDIVGAGSPSSMDLALGHQALERRRNGVRQELGSLCGKYSQATGVVIAINGKVLGGDLYASRALFESLWEKLLDTAANESVGELTSFTKSKLERLPACERLSEILTRGVSAAETELQQLSPRTRITMRRAAGQQVFITRDVGHSDEAVRTAIEMLPFMTPK